MKRFVFSFCVATLSAFASLHSQEKQSPFMFSLELSSKYMWRGLEYGDAPVAFSALSYNSKGFNAFVMGAYAINGSHQEVDLGISYSYKAFCLGFSDYYYPSVVSVKDKYFELGNRSTGHSVEGYLTFSPNKLPLWLVLSTYVYGTDKKMNGDQAFSSYIELGYIYNFTGNNALSLVLGANLNKSFYTDYDKSFNIVNIMLKYTTGFTFGDFKLPVSVSYILNPYREKSYLTFSIYFNS